MSDDEPFYTPGKKPAPPPHYRPQLIEHIWELRKDHVTWSCDLRFHGESYGWEAMILRNGELFVSKRFVLRVSPRTEAMNSDTRSKTTDGANERSA